MPGATLTHGAAGEQALDERPRRRPVVDVEGAAPRRCGAPGRRRPRRSRRRRPSVASATATAPARPRAARLASATATRTGSRSTPAAVSPARRRRPGRRRCRSPGRRRPTARRRRPAPRGGGDRGAGWPARAPSGVKYIRSAPVAELGHGPHAAGRPGSARRRPDRRRARCAAAPRPRRDRVALVLDVRLGGSQRAAAGRRSVSSQRKVVEVHPHIMAVRADPDRSDTPSPTGPGSQADIGPAAGGAWAPAGAGGRSLAGRRRAGHRRRRRVAGPAARAAPGSWYRPSWPTPPELRVDERVYAVSAGELLDVLAGLPDGVRHGRAGRPQPGAGGPGHGAHRASGCPCRPRRSR